MMHYLSPLVPALLDGVTCGPIRVTPAIEARQTYDSATIAYADYRANEMEITTRWSHIQTTSGIQKRALARLKDFL